MVNFEDIKTEDQTYGRGYLVGNEIFPSITTVVSILSEDFIKEWRLRVGEEEANRISRKATEKGNMVHEIAERYLQNDLSEEEFRKYDPVGQVAFQPIKKILDSHVNNILAQEVPLFSNKYRVAGRVDLIAEYDGVLSIIDFKTSGKMKLDSWIEGYFIQETAYAIMLYEMMGIRINQIVTIMTVEDDEPQIFIKHPKDYFQKFVQTRHKFKEEKGV